jgi:hypothetical protein
MIFRSRWRVAATAFLPLVLVVSMGRPCAAQDAPAVKRPSLSETLTGDARTDYDAAKLLFEDGDFAGAASKFRQAYDRAHDPRLLWNIAVCEKGLRHYARVQKLTQRYLEEGRDLLSPEQTKAARDLAEAVKTFVGTLKISAEPGVTILIDGEPAGTTPIAAPILLDLGAHKLTAEKEGKKPFTASVDIAGGSDKTLDVVLAPTSSKAHLSVVAGEGDTIAFDGAVVAATRWQADVEAGTHSLRVTAPQRKAYELHLDLVDGSNRTVEVTLESQSKPLWPWVVGAVALSGLAVVGGYFLFRGDEKASDQPPGSLAPGLVQLSRGLR